MFSRLVIPKGGVVTLDGDGKATLSTTDGKGSVQGGPLASDATDIFGSIFPPGTYHFPNGLEVPKLRSVKIDVRQNVVTVR